MFRNAENELLAWKNQRHRTPLLISGPRQIGKSYLVENFGKKNFDYVLTVNFELDPLYLKCFSSLDPEKILKEIAVVNPTPIIPGRSLLFLDEIQLCPQAIMSLRYFKERLGGVHVIGAGSLLEFALNEEIPSSPVGRVESLYLRPFSFHEFLLAMQQEKLLEALESCSLSHPPSELLHTIALEWVRKYFVLGGMPEILEDFFQGQDYLSAQRMQTRILEMYEKDFFKYPKKINVKLGAKLILRARESE